MSLSCCVSPTACPALCLVLLFSCFSFSLFSPLSMVGLRAHPLPPPCHSYSCGGIKGCFCWPSLFISGVLLNVFALFPVRVHLNALVQAPLRMEMKGVCNEFLSARVPDLTAISQLRGENQRDRERVERWGSEMEARRGSRENTGLFFFFFPFFYTPAFSAWLPSCYNVKLAFL